MAKKITAIAKPVDQITRLENLKGVLTERNKKLNDPAIEQRIQRVIARINILKGAVK